MVSLLCFAIPVKANAPILPDKPPLETPEAREAFAREMSQAYKINESKFVATLSGESIGFTWNDQSLVPANGPNDREDSWGICQIHLPSHSDISKEQALDPRWCIEWSAKQFAKGNASMWSVYRNL